MSTCFCSFCHNCICAGSFYSRRQCQVRYNRYDLDACLLHFSNVFSRISCSCRYHRYFFFAYDIDQFLHIICQKHDIYAKRLVCHLSYFRDLIPQPVSAFATGCDNAKTPAIAYSSRQITFCDPCHSSLDDGILRS